MTAASRIKAPVPPRQLSARVVYAAVNPVLSLASAATGMVIPMMLSPAEFGRYLLVVGIFQICVVCDLGLGQLTDRRVSGCEASDFADPWREAAGLLWLRAGLGGMLSILAVGVALASAWGGADPNVWAGLLAALGGLSFMVADGRVAFYRASSQYRAFVIAALYLQVGLIVPRLAGIYAGGIMGCFLALALWYAAAAAGTVRRLVTTRGTMPGFHAACAVLLASLPLFTSAILWALFLTANRWLSALISDPEQHGYFSFSANLVFLMAGSLATLSQVYYPRISREIMSGTAQPLRLRNEMALFSAAVAVAVVVADLLLGRMVEMAFPAFLPALAPSRLILVSVVPLALASWLLPLLLAVSPRPWIDCAVIFAGAFPALATGMVVGDGMAGIHGQAAGCLPASFVLLAALLLRLGHAKVLKPVVAASLFAACLGASAVTIAAAIWMNHG